MNTRPWPPLIVAEHVPRWVKWRDAVLTLIMWGFFLVLLDKEFELFLTNIFNKLRFGHFDRSFDWPAFGETLTPFLLVTAALVAGLLVFSLRTLQRRRGALLLPRPAPLEAADQARRAGLDEAELSAARNRRIAIVHIGRDGGHRIEVPLGQDAIGRGR